MAHKSDGVARPNAACYVRRRDKHRRLFAAAMLTSVRKTALLFAGCVLGLACAQIAGISPGREKPGAGGSAGKGGDNSAGWSAAGSAGQGGTVNAEAGSAGNAVSSGGVVNAAGTEGTATSGGSAGAAGSACEATELSLCGRKPDGIHCTTSNASDLFGTLESRQSEFSDAQGFKDFSAYTTLQFADIDGDGDSDACARNQLGISCARAQAPGFGALELWEDNFSDNDEGTNWGAHESHFLTIRFPDVNGDRKHDVCGLTDVGVYCSVSDGSRFRDHRLWEGGIAKAWGWLDHPSHYLTVQFPDLDGDGAADVCARSQSGVYCGLSIASQFIHFEQWESMFSDANGFESFAYYPTIAFPRLNDDKYADICAHTKDGIRCALSNGKNAFIDTKIWLSALKGIPWTESRYTASIQFPDLNGDGSGDVCARAPDGVYCALSNRKDAFGPATLWSGAFNDASEWDELLHRMSLRFPDLNADGKADICGRGTQGLVCGISNGTSGFEELKIRQYELSDADQGSNLGNSLQFATMRKGTCDKGPSPGLQVSPIVRYVE